MDGRGREREEGKGNRIYQIQYLGIDAAVRPATCGLSNFILLFLLISRAASFHFFVVVVVDVVVVVCRFDL